MILFFKNKALFDNQFFSFYLLKIKKKIKTIIFFYFIRL